MSPLLLPPPPPRFDVCRRRRRRVGEKRAAAGVGGDGEGRLGGRRLGFTSGPAGLFFFTELLRLSSCSRDHSTPGGAFPSVLGCREQQQLSPPKSAAPAQFSLRPPPPPPRFSSLSSPTVTCHTWPQVNSHDQIPILLPRHGTLYSHHASVRFLRSSAFKATLEVLLGGIWKELNGLLPPPPPPPVRKPNFFFPGREIFVPRILPSLVLSHTYSVVVAFYAFMGPGRGSRADVTLWGGPGSACPDRRGDK